jgi:hypothetical protein
MLPTFPPAIPEQDELEEVLFALLRQRGYGDEYVRRYQMVTLFYQQKRPLIILIAGSACTGANQSHDPASEAGSRYMPVLCHECRMACVLTRAAPALAAIRTCCQTDVGHIAWPSLSGPCCV